jgi:hypothetical protein
VNQRLPFVLALIGCALPLRASAQAPVSAPLVLHLPSSARTAALGNAWVAGRDAEVIFYNPAQLVGARQEFAASVNRPGSAGTAASAASVYAAGKWSLTLGWGAQFVGFNVDPAAAYPYADVSGHQQGWRHLPHARAPALEAQGFCPERAVGGIPGEAGPALKS